MAEQFTNPGRGGKNRDKYVHRSIYDISQDPGDQRLSDLNEQAIFRLLESGEFNMKEALESGDTPLEIRQNPGEVPEEIESFTEVSPIVRNLEDSYFDAVQFNPDTGLMKILNSAGEPFGAWIPWIQEEKKGSVMAQIYHPWKETIETVIYGNNDTNTEDLNPQLLNTIYVLGRETIPEVPTPIGRGKWDSDDFKQRITKIQQYPKKEEEDYLTQLEKYGEVEIGNEDYIGEKQGRDALDYLDGVLKNARGGRIIDYFTEIDWSNSKLEIVNGGYKFLTKLEDTDYEDPMEAIDGRLADSWGGNNGK